MNSGTTGGAGGNGTSGSGGGSGGTTNGNNAQAGTLGGGGGGGGEGTGTGIVSGASGGAEDLWNTGVGPSGGGGGGGGAGGTSASGNKSGGSGGTYGGGGGGAGYSGSHVFSGGTGGQGIIVITYTPVSDVPSVSNVSLNGGSAITLSPNATTTVTVVASTSDSGGAGAILYATGTIYRTSLGSGCAADNANCYQIASSSCAFSGSTSTVTCSAAVWYFAQSTGNASSSFPSDSWTGAITMTDAASSTASATSSGVDVNVLTAITVTTSTIGYGTIMPSSTTGGTNQATIVQNAGNSSSSLTLSGTALISGTRSIATSSQHYATSTFVFGGGESQLSGVNAAVSGFSLQGPTGTSPVAGTIYWGLGVPQGSATGTYSGTVTFTGVWSP